MGALGEKGEGIKNYNWQSQKSHREVTYSIGNIVSKIVMTVWCQMGARLPGGSLCVS